MCRTFAVASPLVAWAIMRSMSSGVSPGRLWTTMATQIIHHHTTLTGGSGSPLHGKQAQNGSRRCQVSDRRLSSAVSMVSLQFERANR
jgi:hypothetical protein